MKIFLMAFFATWACFALNLAKAQQVTGSISGLVIDKNKNPVDAATIALVNAKDSSVVKSMLANTDGTFVFDGLKAGNYKILVTAISFFNYKSLIISVNAQPVKLPPAVLLQSNKALKEVAIGAESLCRAKDRPHGS